MIRIGNIGGLFALIYIWYNYWTVSINSSTVISPKLVGVIHFVPYFSITGVFLIMTTLYAWSLITHKGAIPLYILSVYLMVLVTKISLNILMIQDTTTIVPFIVNHLVPLNMKLYHLQTELFQAILSRILVSLPIALI